MAYIKPILFFLLIVLFYQSCKSVKTFENKGTPPTRSLQDVMTELRKNNLDFTWYDAKIDMDIESTEFGGSGSAVLRMKKDSAIWVVVKKLGIEGGRMLMREDSAFLINRFERYFQREQVSKIKRKMGLNLTLGELQKAMAGNFILPQDAQIKSYRQEGNSCLIETSMDGNNITYNINAFNLLPQGILINDGRQKFVEIKYYEYEKRFGLMLPIRFDIQFESEDGSGSLQLHVKEVNIDIPKDLSFSIPSRYDEVYW
ncbi:MAG TPA: DUF4292 domain-containing protein [Saprospiraceae bacterium]|nr:DUF4292 domain-containing protein [Saprospiraceae bacterium]HPN69490.1 DUF4292 domain-containing protein [Saprospiraceae bacterium]